MAKKKTFLEKHGAQKVSGMDGEFINFENEGDFVIGKFIDKFERQNKFGNSEHRIVLEEYDEDMKPTGRNVILPPHSILVSRFEKIEIGDYVYVEYTGETQTKDKKPVKNYDVYVLKEAVPY